MRGQEGWRPLANRRSHTSMSPLLRFAIMEGRAERIKELEEGGVL